jgi:hypothetical protein
VKWTPATRQDLEGTGWPDIGIVVVKPNVDSFRNKVTLLVAAPSWKMTDCTDSKTLTIIIHEVCPSG